jgi:hypothetical protein
LPFDFRRGVVYYGGAPMHLTAVDFLIIVTYVGFVLAIGVVLKDRVAHSADALPLVLNVVFW